MLQPMDYFVFPKQFGDKGKNNFNKTTYSPVLFSIKQEKLSFYLSLVLAKKIFPGENQIFLYLTNTLWVVTPLGL